MFFHFDETDETIVDSYILTEYEVIEKRIAEVRRLNEGHDLYVKEFDRLHTPWYVRLRKVN